MAFASKYLKFNEDFKDCALKINRLNDPKRARDNLQQYHISLRAKLTLEHNEMDGNCFRVY
jgi:hypothetical protein